MRIRWGIWSVWRRRRSKRWFLGLYGAGLVGVGWDERWWCIEIGGDSLHSFFCVLYSEGFFPGVFAVPLVLFVCFEANCIL